MVLFQVLNDHNVCGGCTFTLCLHFISNNNRPHQRKQFNGMTCLNKWDTRPRVCGSDKMASFLGRKTQSIKSLQEWEKSLMTVCPASVSVLVWWQLGGLFTFTEETLSVAGHPLGLTRINEGKTSKYHLRSGRAMSLCIYVYSFMEEEQAVCKDDVFGV